MNPPDLDPITRSLLHVMRTSLGVAVTVSQLPASGINQLGQAETARDGHRWVAQSDDPYRALVLLAERLGMDLEE